MQAPYLPANPVLPPGPCRLPLRGLSDAVSNARASICPAVRPYAVHTLNYVNVTTKDQNYDIPPVLGAIVTLTQSHLCSCVKSPLCSDRIDWKLLKIQDVNSMPA